MKMPSSKPQAYVLERERSEDSKNQTVFYLRPRKAAQTATTLERASRMRKVGRDNQEYYEAQEWLRGEQGNFVDMIWKIDNYHFSDDFPEYADAPRNIGETDEDLKKKVFADLPDNDRVELVNALNSMSKLSDEARKKSNSSVTSSTGNLTQLNG
jgi:hypothetical protein